MLRKSISLRNAVLGRPHLTVAQEHGLSVFIRGRMQRVRCMVVRPSGIIAQGYVGWLKDYGLVPVVKLSSQTQTGLKRSRLRACVRTRVPQLSIPRFTQDWMPMAQYNALRRAEGKRPYVFDTSMGILDAGCRVTVDLRPSCAGRR